jgi:hypothetical protein
MLGDSQESFPYLLSGPVSCCSAGDLIAVFMRGPVGDLLMKWWDGKQWSQFESLGSPRDYNPIYPAVTVPTPLTGHPTPRAAGAPAGSTSLHGRWMGTSTTLGGTRAGSMTEGKWRRSRQGRQLSPSRA